MLWSTVKRYVEKLSSELHSQEARDHFLSAERLKPEGWKENRLFIAKAMLKLGQQEEAEGWLRMAREMQIKNSDVRTRLRRS